MLPTEAFAEAVAFLQLFDLDALLLANALCSSLALKASTASRWEEFPGLVVYIANRWIGIGPSPSLVHEDGQYRCRLVDILAFPSEKELVEFVAAALPNCIFDDIAFNSNLSKQIRDAISRVANTVVIRGVLCPSYNMIRDDTVELVRTFRKVKALLLVGRLNDEEANEIANLYQESGVQELHYHHINGGKRKKLALF
ncbi:hypothetical protein AAVH_29773 [Aphelenchoides avenae]|nr:hypothetical protein AAVH_29773 [Aphelenchus avenae]